MVHKIWSNFRLLWLVLEAASRTIFVHVNISKSKTSFCPRHPDIEETGRLSFSDDLPVSYIKALTITV
jgi:hypothetical protein